MTKVLAQTYNFAKKIAKSPTSFSFPRNNSFKLIEFKQNSHNSANMTIFIANIFVTTNIFSQIYRYFMSCKHCHKMVNMCHMWLTNFCLKKTFLEKSTSVYFSHVFSPWSLLYHSLCFNTKQGKEKALCDALKCCGHEELFFFIILSCNKCIVGKSSQLSVKGRNFVKQSPRYHLLCQQGSIKKAETFKKIERLQKDGS